MEEIDPVGLAVPFFILAIVLELLLGRLGWAKARYEPKDTFTSLAMGLGSSVAGLATAGVIFAASLWVYQHRLFDIPMTAVWAWVLIFLLEDKTYYWFLPPRRMSAGSGGRATSITTPRSTTTSPPPCGRPGRAGWPGPGCFGCRSR